MRFILVIEIHWGLFPRVQAIQDFLHLSRLHLAHHIKLRRTSDIIPLWGAYVEYPLPTECSTCAMATGISEKMGDPYVEDSVSNFDPCMSILQCHTTA